MPRASGFVVLAVLVLAIVAFRTSGSQRATRLIAGEERARLVVAALHGAARAELDAGRPLPTLAALLGAAEGLELLPEVGDGRAQYARDAGYAYGMLHTGAGGYVLRAWPWTFGVTGDTEWYVTQDGELWQGQNELGRSGLQRAFPPPFPEPALSGESARWWRRPLSDDG